MLCVSDHREVCLVEGDLAVVELNIELVVLLLVCVTMMTIIIINDGDNNEFSCTGVYLNCSSSYEYSVCR